MVLGCCASRGPLAAALLCPCAPLPLCSAAGFSAVLLVGLWVTAIFVLTISQPFELAGNGVCVPAQRTHLHFHRHQTTLHRSTTAPRAPFAPVYDCPPLPEHTNTHVCTGYFGIWFSAICSVGFLVQEMEARMPTSRRFGPSVLFVCASLVIFIESFRFAGRDADFPWGPSGDSSSAALADYALASGAHRMALTEASHTRVHIVLPPPPHSYPQLFCSVVRVALSRVGMRHPPRRARQRVQ